MDLKDFKPKKYKILEQVIEEKRDFGQANKNMGQKNKSNFVPPQKKIKEMSEDILTFKKFLHLGNEIDLWILPVQL